jgi:cell division protease FtsH
LANIINEAGLLAARNNKRVITDDEIEEAKERVVMGVKNQSKIKKEDEIKLIAYHEAGHVLVTLNCKNTDPIYKATIISRGNAGGYVARLPENDKHYTSITKASIIDDITIAMGGRVAERVVFGDDKVTAGALSDLKAATHYANNMVVSWGMNEKVGPVYCLNKIKSEGYNGLEASSNEMLKLIDYEIKIILENAEKRATDIITNNRNKLNIIADALMKYETLTGDEINKLINGEKIRIEDEMGDNGGEKKDFNGHSLFSEVLKGNKDEKS